MILKNYLMIYKFPGEQSVYKAIVILQLMIKNGNNRTREIPTDKGIFRNSACQPKEIGEGKWQLGRFGSKF
jgi:hypothetical protein